MEKSHLPAMPPKFNGAAEIRTETGYTLTRSDSDTMNAVFGPSEVFLCLAEDGGSYVLPLRSDRTRQGRGRSPVWVLPAESTGNSYEIRCEGELAVDCTSDQTEITFFAECAEVTIHPRWPAADLTGAGFEIRSEELPEIEMLVEATAAFYWHTLLPSVAERGRAAGFPVREGYVLSTLEPGAYPGTYPDVDHEFQIKGRLALGGAFDCALVRRMLELQLKLMAEDPEGLWRNPCSLQPDGSREYHVRRSSQNGRENAVMFLLTGNVEVLESAWLYYAATKDQKWLREHIGGLECAALLVEEHTDRYGRLWTDVFYEDQVIKDGRECMSAALAARGLTLLSELETALGRTAKARRYNSLSKKLSEALVRPVPQGFWDTEHQRFVDWVDRSGGVHDHIHQLANNLPDLFGYTSPHQSSSVARLMERHNAAFQRFPSFVAARIEDYTDSEIGSGGPYDLCAAGRYWCWDAAWLASKNRSGALYKQLCHVAQQARLDGYEMGERYDMDYVYYVGGRAWHGAAHYYEYPCVFIWVLITQYLGFCPDLEADFRLAPRITGRMSVRLAQSRWQFAYTWDGTVLKLRNLAGYKRSVRLDLSAVIGGTDLYHVSGAGGARLLRAGDLLLMEAGDILEVRGHTPSETERSSK